MRHLHNDIQAGCTLLAASTVGRALTLTYGFPRSSSPPCMITVVYVSPRGEEMPVIRSADTDKIRITVHACKEHLASLPDVISLDRSPLVWTEFPSMCRKWPRDTFCAGCLAHSCSVVRGLGSMRATGLCVVCRGRLRRVRRAIRDTYCCLRRSGWLPDDLAGHILLMLWRLPVKLFGPMSLERGDLEGRTDRRSASLSVPGDAPLAQPSSIHLSGGSAKRSHPGDPETRHTN